MPKAPDLTYEDARAAQLERLTTVRLIGVPLKDKGRASRRWIIPCFCVHDAPDNPCSCDGPIIGFPLDALVQEVASNRQDEQGRELSEFVIRRDAELIVERPRVVRADTYAVLTDGRVHGGKPPSMLASPAAFNAWVKYIGFWFGVGTWLAEEAGDPGGEILEGAVKEGKQFAEDMGHIINEPIPGLVPD